MKDASERGRTQLPEIVTLWVEGGLSYIERLCLMSMLAQGHEVTLYTYHEVKNVPKKVRIADASHILPESRMLRHKNTGSYALGSDIFRYESQRLGLGTWLDLDVYCLKPLSFASEYLYGWEDEEKINGAVLRIPSNSELLEDLLGLCYSKPVIAPWWLRRKKLKQYARYLIGTDHHIEDIRWGDLGPTALTYYSIKHDVARLAKDRTVFYPVHYSQADMLFNPHVDVEAIIGKNTITIHLWNERVGSHKQSPPPEGSFIDAACKKHGIDIGI